MKIHKLGIEGLLLIESEVFTDERGYFLELFNEKRFSGLNLTADFCQDNLSVSKKNVIRGLHFQESPHAQGKLVRVIRGAVLDVAVDLRLNSPTFGTHESLMLTESNNHVLWIPAGFAHGFAVLDEGTIFHYKCDAPYFKAAETGIRFDDRELSINWNITNPVVSEKDRELMSFADYKRKSGMKTTNV
ncbi:MAG: dTDP-4-dehydrorhamnose 3,5-epimerase [Bacteroidota bacterium]